MAEVRKPGSSGGGISGASNDGAGVPLFERQQGQTLVFRTIRSTHPGIVLTEQAGEVQASLDVSQISMDGGTYE